jgi:hypothetical protein
VRRWRNGTGNHHRTRLGEAVYSDCVSDLLRYLGVKSAVSSENPLKSLRNRADFDSAIRRFESSRPSQLLANEIKHLLKSLFFIMMPVQYLEFSRPRQESEKLHHIAFVQKLKEFRFA